jgi:hypothetical protein
MDVLEQVPDEELELLAAENGIDSLEATTLNELRRERALDKQVFAFRIGAYYMIGPIPDANTEITMMLASEYIKRVKL